SLDSEKESTPNWSSYKLIVDPALNVGSEKLHRYDGQYFSAPNPGISPLDDVQDPRITRFWTRFKETDLAVPKFKTDENYVGPPKEVTFSRLNDNIKADFLADMCRKFGEIQEVEVLYHPKTKKHLGIAKVIFEMVKGANEAVRKLHDTTVMGNTIHAELDPGGEKRMRYFQLLLSGLYTSFTLPVSVGSWGSQSPPYNMDPNSDYESVKCLTNGLLSSLVSSSMLSGSTPFDGSTPLSMDTAYSSMHQDTPSSFWQTPQYQDTPHTSPLSHSNPGTPTPCEEPSDLSHLSDTPGTYNSQTIPRLTPLLPSESQPTCHNPHLVQLTPHKPNTRQAAINNSISLIAPSHRSSKGAMTLGCQSNPVNRVPCSGRRGRVWGAKYQNAYNRRPEHRYVHRPVFNRSHHRSRSATSLVPVYPSPRIAPSCAQLDKSPVPAIQCSSSTNKPTGCWEQKALPLISISSEPPVNLSVGDVDKEPILPISNSVRGADIHHIQTEPVSCVQPLEKMLENVPLKTSLSRASQCNSPSPVPDMPQGHTVEELTPEQSTSPGPEPEQSSSVGSPAPDPLPSSLDTRIQMLLGAQNSGPFWHEEKSGLDTHSEDFTVPLLNNLHRTSTSAPPSPQTQDVSSTPDFSVASSHCGSAQKQEGSSESGFDDVSPEPLPDSPEEGEESLSSNKCLSKISVISSLGLTTWSTQAPSNQATMIKQLLRGGGTSEQTTGPGTCSGGSSPTPPVFRIPPPPVFLPPPAFPVPPPPILPQNVPGLRGFPLLPPPVRLTPPPPNLPIPPSTFYPPPNLSTEKVGRPCQWKSQPAPLPIPTRITQGKAQPVYPPPFPVLSPPTPFPGTSHDGSRHIRLPPFNPSSGLAAVPGYRDRWPPPLLPVFDPTVPPPGYAPACQPLHKATVEGVLAAVAAELRATVKKDIRRRIVEGLAFAAFDQWWDEKSRSAKKVKVCVPSCLQVSVIPVKSGESKEKDSLKPRVLEAWQTAESLAPEGMALGINLPGLGLRSSLRLPSFKVKRKDISGKDSVDAKKTCPSSPGQVITEDAEALQAAHMGEETEETSQTHSETPMVRRRHARPLELDSEDEEEESVFLNVEDSGSTQEENNRTELPATDQDDEEDKDERDEGGLSGTREDGDLSDEEVISLSSSSVQTESSSSSSSSSSSHLDCDSTLSSRFDLKFSEKSHYSSESDSACSEENYECGGEHPPSEGTEQERQVDEVWISSDEDDDKYKEVPRTPACLSVVSLGQEMEPPLTPSAPHSNHRDLEQDFLDADPEEELRVRVFLQGYGHQDPVAQHLSNKLQLCDPALLPSDHDSELHFPQSPSYKAFSSDEEMETQSESELSGAYQERPMDSPEFCENLRPPTPTGSLAESDPDLELRHRLWPPAAEEMEVPRTPGGGLEMEVETLVLSPPPPTPLPPPPSPTGFLRFPSPPLELSPLPLTSTYPAYDETPRTPGNHAKHEELHISAGVTTAMLSCDAVLGLSPPSPSLSPHAGSGVPRTPGRDIAPTSPISDRSEVTIHRGGHQREPHPLCARRGQTLSVSSSPCSPSFPASVMPSPSPPEQSELTQRRPGVSSNQTAHLDAEQLKKRKGRLRCKKSNRAGDLIRKSPLYLESWGHFSRESGHTAEGKTPLQGLENRVEDRLHPRMVEDHRRPECLYPWRKGSTWPHGSQHFPRFARRSRRREQLLLHAVWAKGVNTEEISHLQASYEHMLHQDKGYDWLTSTHWTPHPHILNSVILLSFTLPENGCCYIALITAQVFPMVASVPDERPQRCMGGGRHHWTGCARTEGFYIISKRDKLRYLHHTHSIPEEPAAEPQRKLVHAQLSSSSRSGSEFRAEQRRLLASFGCDSDLLKFNQLKFRKKRLRFNRSLIHDWGLFAEEHIMADEMVIEYVGQSIRQLIADMRERRYEQEGIGSSYLFRVDQDTIIDATKCGNLARFINHSCNDSEVPPGFLVCLNRLKQRPEIPGSKAL
ncbi:hypothetical protein P4O66_017458, partial [Electrophorus voltai]